MGAGGDSGSGYSDRRNTRPSIVNRTSRPLGRNEISGTISGGDARRNTPSVARAEGRMSSDDARNSFNRATGRDGMESGGSGGTPLFLTPNGLLIPSGKSEDEELDDSSTTDNQPDQTGNAPRRRAASLLTLGLAETTRKSLLGR